MLYLMKSLKLSRNLKDIKTLSYQIMGVLAQNQFQIRHFGQTFVLHKKISMQN